MKNNYYLDEYNKYRQLINKLIALYQSSNYGISIYVPDTKNYNMSINNNGIEFSYKSKFTFNCEPTEESNIIFKKNEDFVCIDKHFKNFNFDNDGYICENKSEVIKLAYIDGFLVCGSCCCIGRKCNFETKVNSNEYLLMSYVGYDFDFDNPDVEIDNIVQERDLGDFSDIVKKFYEITESSYVLKKQFS